MGAFLILFVFLVGGAINANNTGGLKSGHELIQDTKAAIEHRVADYSHLND